MLDRHSRHVLGGASGATLRRRSGLAGRRAKLEARWRQTLERITALSVAYHDAAATCLSGLPSRLADHAGGASRLGPGGQDVARLGRRVVAERQALADIEAALDRIATGQYGRCEQCCRPISAGLLARRPEARFCSACSCRPAPPVAYA